MSTASADHVTNVFVVANDNEEYVKGDPFWPVLCDNITAAARTATMADAKKYLKTAEKRLKPKQKLHIVPCEASYDASFQLVGIKEVINDKPRDHQV